MFKREPDTKNTSISFLSTGVSITGDIRSDQDLRIEGSLSGNISCTAKLIIGPGAHIRGDVSAHSLEITGKLSGNARAEERLVLSSCCFVEGDIQANIIEIESGARFWGTCKMMELKEDSPLEERAII